MEEKERFSISIINGILYLYDNFNKYNTEITLKDLSDLLNQQDKRIKELQESNEPLKKSKAHFKKVAENVVDLLRKLNKFIGEPQTQELNYCKVIEDTKNYIEELKQSRKQLAISELEKLKDFFIEEPCLHKDEEMGTEFLITKYASSIADYVLNRLKIFKEEDQIKLTKSSIYQIIKYTSLKCTFRNKTKAQILPCGDVYSPTYGYFDFEDDYDENLHNKNDSRFDIVSIDLYS